MTGAPDVEALDLHAAGVKHGTVPHEEARGV